VAAIPHLSTQEALVPDAFNSKEEYVPFHHTFHTCIILLLMLVFSEMLLSSLLRIAFSTMLLLLFLKH